MDVNLWRKMLKKKIGIKAKKTHQISIMDCFLKQISDKIEFTLIMNPDKDFLKRCFSYEFFVFNYVCLITMHLRRWLNQTINLLHFSVLSVHGNNRYVWPKKHENSSILFSNRKIPHFNVDVFHTFTTIFTFRSEELLGLLYAF